MERFERPTDGFEARCSIQLSYKREQDERFLTTDFFLGKKKNGSTPCPYRRHSASAVGKCCMGAQILREAPMARCLLSPGDHCVLARDRLLA